MTEDNGERLKKQAKKALDLSGFEPEEEKRFQGQKFDIFCEFEGLKIGFICKKFRSSTLSAKNFIKEWIARKRNFEVHRLVLVLAGCEVLNEDLRLAEENDIAIWDRKNLKEVLDKAIKQGEENKIDLLESLNIIPRDMG